MVKKVIITPKEEYAYGYIINALAGGLYPNKFHAIREYIQNSFDGIKGQKNLFGEKEELGIKITIKKPSIFIFDNGIGMNRITLNEYRKVGFSKKKVGEFAGFRGIGKLAGISVARKMIVTTSTFGVPESYTLVFDAGAMLKEVNKLKKKRESISLNKLIEKYTQLSSEVEKKESHYTMVELHDIRPDSKILFEVKKLGDYIGRNAPVGFDPNFEYAKEIEEDIKKFVEDYDYVDISVDGQNIYKPYVNELKSQQHILVWNKNKTKLLAYCWYCENKNKGQVKPEDISGLVYRYKNFSVGDTFLPRKTIWNTSPHLAFYFIGEIYICDDEMMPTSQRDDFEQNVARDRFYKEAVVIQKELNSIARESSGVRRAIDFITAGKELVDITKQELDKGEFYLRYMSTEKIAQIVTATDNIKKRERNLPEAEEYTEYRLLAKEVVKQGKKLLGNFEDAEKSGEFLDICEKIELNKQANGVYSVIIRTLKDFFVDEPEQLEKLIKLIHKNLMSFFSKNKK